LQGEQNQWIRYPQILTDHVESDEPSEKIFESANISLLNDCINMWSRTVEELLAKLKDTIPGAGMIGEVHYWRDLSRVLDGISAELKQPQVELTVQTLLQKDEKVLTNDVTAFTKLKSRVMKGAKEARWNNKYMKVIEKPVKQIEMSDDLMDI